MQNIIIHYFVIFVISLMFDKCFVRWNYIHLFLVFPMKIIIAKLFVRISMHSFSFCVFSSPFLCCRYIYLQVFPCSFIQLRLHANIISRKNWFHKPSFSSLFCLQRTHESPFHLWKFHLRINMTKFDSLKRGRNSHLMC